MTLHKHNTYLVKDDAGTEIAAIYIRYTHSDGSGAGEWLVTGNRRAYDASTQPYLNRVAYTSGVRLQFNRVRHPDVAAVRVTNAVSGVGGLPAAGVVMGIAETDTSKSLNGCGRGDRLVLANNTGAVNVNAAPVTFRSNNLFVLDRAAADTTKPIAIERWTASAVFADSTLAAPVPAWTFYRFEVFKQGNNSGVADHTFTTAILAPVPLASAGRSFKWAQFDAATRALAATGPAVEAPTVGFTVPTGGLAPTSAAVFGRPTSTDPRTISSAQIPFGSTSVAVPTESPARAGCGTGPALPEMGSTGFGFRGVSVFRQAPDTTFHDNGLQWNNWQ